MKSSTKKNVTLLGVGAALCLATAASLGAMSVGKASAESITNPATQGESTVTYTNGSSWTVEIPDSITVNATNAQISASDVNTPNGLDITVSSENGFTLKNEKLSAGIPYTLKVAEESEQLGEGTQISEGGTVLTVSGGSEQSASTYVGAYVDGSPITGSEAATDTLTFTIVEK